MTAKRARDLGSLDGIRLDRQRRSECQTWRRVREKVTKLRTKSLLVIDGDKVQPNPHRPHVGV